MHPMSKKEKKPEDVTPEEQTEQAVPTEETEAEAPNPLLEELEALKKSLSDQEDKFLRLAAEYDNYRRRTREEASKKYTEGRSDVVSSLFAIGDNLERALAACADEKTRQGVEMVLKSYKKVLEGENVEEIDPTGQPFDASFAEAIMAVAPEEGEEHGVVKQVYEKGYKRGDKVLRYAKVIVTQ